jgi:hypothetical protein
MTRLYNPREIYDPVTMPRVEGFTENNNCDFVRFHWVPTEEEQKHVDERGGHIFYRHSLINSKMYLATTAGAGIPGWEDLGSRLAQGRRVEPTGLADDPRLPPREPTPAGGAGGDILYKLYQADACYWEAVDREHMRLLAEHDALRTGTWAQRASAPKAQPTREDGRRSYEARLQERDGDRCERRATLPGIWHEWEIVEIAREQARIDAIDDAEARTDATMKSIYPCWGGGT